MGAGSRPALAIHCTLAHSGAWAGLARALSDQLAITTYDLPSHGRSAEWDGTGNLHDVATDMARPLLDQPMDVIGHSFGATVALRLAVEHPQKVRSLTMIEPVYFASAMVDEPARISAHDASVTDFNNAIKQGRAEDAARAFNRAWGDGSKWEDIPQQIRDYMTARIHVVPAGVPMLYEDSAGLLAEGVLARAAMPSLLIEGERSIDVVDAINGSLAQRLPQATRAVIKDAGHMAPITHPQEVANVISDLLARS